jgi:hypothetical protein
MNKTYKSLKSKKSDGMEQNSSQKEKYIKLRYRGKEKKIRFDEFMMVKGLDKQKLQASKDSMIQMMKRKIEFYKTQDEVYNMDILNRISLDREKELRNAVFSLQKEIRRKRQRSKEELESLYKSVLTEIQNIYEKTTAEIDQRKSDLMDRIMLSIANCDYKQAQLLEMKIKEQEELFRNLHMFTFEMQQVRDNFENSLKKIQILSDNNYDLKKSIFQEKLKFQHITSLMKEFKMRTNFMANKINNYKATTHFLENNNNEQRLNWSSKKKTYIDANANNNLNKRPFSSAYSNNKVKTLTFGTNYTQNNTNPRMFSENNLKRSSKLEIADDSKILFNKTDREEEKRKDLKLSVLNNEIISMTEGNIANIKRKANYEKNIINVLQKDIEIWKNKIVNIANKYKDNIPDNEIYFALTKIVEALRLDKSNKFFGQNNNNVINTSMMALPVQNKQFRKIFLDLLFRNKDIFEAIRTGQKNDVDKYFTKNLFGAEKIKK